MKTRTTGIVLGALMLPVAAYAQVVSGAIVGGVIGGPVGAAVGATIGAANVAAFNSYVAANTVTYPVYAYTAKDGKTEIVVGDAVPNGTIYYRVPPEYGTGYYTVINGHTVLVDVATGKVVRVVS